MESVLEQKFVVVEKIHTLLAPKELYKEGLFKKLPSHDEGTILCFILQVPMGPANILYSHQRGNDVVKNMKKETTPQDFVKYFVPLSRVAGVDQAQEALNKMMILAMLGTNDSVTVRKFGTWPAYALDPLIQVIEYFETFQMLLPNP